MLEPDATFGKTYLSAPHWNSVSGLIKSVLYEQHRPGLGQLGPLGEIEWEAVLYSLQTACPAWEPHSLSPGGFMHTGESSLTIFWLEGEKDQMGKEISCEVNEQRSVLSIKFHFHLTCISLKWQKHRDTSHLLQNIHHVSINKQSTDLKHLCTW